MLTTGHVMRENYLCKNLVGKEEEGSVLEGTYYQEHTVYSGQLAGSQMGSVTIVLLQHTPYFAEDGELSHT